MPALPEFISWFNQLTPEIWLGLPYRTRLKCVELFCKREWGHCNWELSVLLEDMMEEDVLKMIEKAAGKPGMLGGALVGQSMILANRLDKVPGSALAYTSLEIYGRKSAADPL